MIITLTADNVEAIGRCIINEVLAAYQAGDYQLLTRHFSPTLKQQLSQQYFEQTLVDAITPLGEVLSSEYEGHLKRINEHQLTWKVTYEHRDEPLLWQLCLCDDETPICITQLSFT